MATSGDQWVVGSSGTVLRSDGGGTWTAETTPNTAFLGAIWAASETDLWAVSGDGTVIHSDGGGTWTLETTPVTSFLLGIWGSSATDLWAVMPSGALVTPSMPSAKPDTWSASAAAWIGTSRAST